MKLMTTTAIIAALATAQALPAAAQQAMSQQEAQQIAASVLESWNKAFAARDPAGLAAQYTEDYVMANPPPGGSLTGRTTMAQHWASNFKAYSPNPDTLVEVRAISDVAIWVVLGWSGTEKGPKGPETHQGVNGRVYVKDGNSWKIRMESWGYGPTPQ